MAGVNYMQVGNIRGAGTVEHGAQWNFPVYSLLFDIWSDSSRFFVVAFYTFLVVYTSFCKGCENFSVHVGKYFVHFYYGFDVLFQSRKNIHWSGYVQSAFLADTQNSCQCFGRTV